MELVLILGGVVLAGLVVLLVLSLGDKGPSDDEMFRRFTALTGFTITERHAHGGTGMAADETRGLVAIHGKGREKMVLLSARDIASWRYQKKDEVFEMAVKSYRHAEPFLITFRKSATADEWIKIFRKMFEEHT